jgi:hypothetical protein
MPYGWELPSGRTFAQDPDQPTVRGYFEQPMIVETKDEKIADAIRAIANYPWGGEKAAAQEIILSHGTVEVIAYRFPNDVRKQILRDEGWEPADPVTLCHFISGTGWPNDGYAGLVIGAVWNGACWSGMGGKRGARFNANPAANRGEPEVCVYMRQVKK